MIPGGAAISSVAISARPEWGVVFLAESSVDAESSVRLNVYAATIPFVTMASNTLASTSFLSTLRGNFSFERSIDIGGSIGSVAVSIAHIELDNSEALYDDRINYTVDGEEIVLKVGPAPAVNEGAVDYDSFYEVARFMARRKVLDESTFAIEGRGKSFMLDVPASPDVYLGTGNLEGSDDVKGKRKPRAYGWVNGVTAAELLPVELIYQVDGYGSVQDISAVYDTGVTLDFDADYQTLDLLRVAALVPGEFATCVASGLFMLGGMPFGQVTADVEGADDDGFVETTAPIIRHLVLAATAFTTSGLAQNTFDFVDIQQPATIGYFIPLDSNETVLQVINKLMAPVFGYCGATRLGKLEVALIGAPSVVSVASYDTTQVVSLRREEMPDNLFPPPQRVRMAWDRNWTQLSSVAGEEDDSVRVAYLRSPYRVVSTSQDDVDSILRDYPSATDPEVIDGYFRDEDDALEAAEQRHEFLRGSKATYRATLPSHPFVHDLLDTINLTRPRFDLGDGKSILLIRVRDDIATVSQEVAGVG